MKKVYIAGPMRGIPHHNYPAFDAAAKELRSCGWVVVSPKEISECFGYLDPDVDDNFPNYGGARSEDEIKDFILQDIHAILRCDEVCVLPGWENSRGAQMEVAVARMARKKIFTYADSTEL